MEQEQKQLKILDFYKVSMMLLVAAYHACLGWDPIWSPCPLSCSEAFRAVFASAAVWLDSVHVPAFVFASGYLFFFLRYEKGKYRNGPADIGRRADRLLLPCFVVGILWCAPFYKVLFHTGIPELVKKYVLAAAPSQLWFLPMLFWVFVFFYLLSDRFRAMKPPVAVLLLYLLGVAGRVLLRLSGVFSVFQTAVSLKYLLYFYLGGMFRTRKAPSPGWSVTLIAVGALGALGVARAGVWWGSVLLSPAVSVCGILGFFGLFHCFGITAASGGPVFRVLKKYSMSVFLLHQQIMYLWLFAVKDLAVWPPLTWAILFFGTVAVSLLLSALIARLPFGKRVLGIG